MIGRCVCECVCFEGKKVGRDIQCSWARLSFSEKKVRRTRRARWGRKEKVTRRNPRWTQKNCHSVVSSRNHAKTVIQRLVVLQLTVWTHGRSFYDLHHALRELSADVEIYIEGPVGLFRVGRQSPGGTQRLLSCTVLNERMLQCLPHPEPSVKSRAASALWPRELSKKSLVDIQGLVWSGSLMAMRIGAKTESPKRHDSDSLSPVDRPGACMCSYKQPAKGPRILRASLKRKVRALFEERTNMS